MASPYNVDEIDFRIFDSQSEIKRWFENYKPDSNILFYAERTEFILVEPRQGGGYRVVIGDEITPERKVYEIADRKVPPPPTWYQKPAVSLSQHRAEIEERTRRVRDWRKRMASFDSDYYDPFAGYRMGKSWFFKDYVGGMMIKRDNLAVVGDAPRPTVDPVSQLRRNQ